MQTPFNSKYPIVEAIMNGGSSLPLALACHEAGIFPSLFPQDRDPVTRKTNHDILEAEIKEFVKFTGSSNFLLGVNALRLDDPKVLRILKDYKITHIELIVEDMNRRLNSTPILPWVAHIHKNYDRLVKEFLNFLQPTIILQRIKEPTVNTYSFAFGAKGSESAGVNSTEFTTSELFDRQQKLTPNGIILPYGGIGTPTQVADYVRRGAAGVVVGTLLAASKESNLPLAIKQAMVKTKKEDVIRLPDTGQNSLILGDRDAVINSKIDQDDWNREHSLKSGLTGNSDSGHMYIGSSIDYVKDILSVKEIVDYLVSEL